MSKFARRPESGISPLTGRSGSIFEELERRFAKGRYKFGEQINQGELAAEFGVSSQPVRAALGQLRTLGYVIIVPQVGCKVASPTASDIRDFFDLFGRMEGVMAKLAAERHDSKAARALVALTDEITAAPVPSRGLPDQYIDLVAQWHGVIRAMADSPTLAWRLNSFWCMSDFILWQGASDIAPQSLVRANEQRRQIMQSILARETERAEQLMCTHVQGKPFRVGIIAGSGDLDLVESAA